MTQPSQPLYTYSGGKSNIDIRDGILRTIANGLRGIGIPNPNVGPNSDYYLIATGIGNELAVISANNVISADQNMPDTAGGSFLDRWLAINNLGRNSATNSFGQITITVSAPSTLIIQGQQLTDTLGSVFQVSVGGTYSNNAQVPIVSVSTGSGTNHENGDTLTWVTAPAYCQENVVVGVPGGSDGLTGGNDSEVGLDEPPRARLLARLQNPPKGGNAADVMAWGASSSPDVGGVFVYPALLGPSTAFVAVCSNPQTIGTLESNSKNRDLPVSLVTGTLLPFIIGNLPEHSLCVVASVVNEPIDVAFLVALTAAPTASPPGPGGGWLDGTPWPSSIGGYAPVQVIAFATSTQFTVNATTSPQVGVNHIAWISPNNWTIYSATVLSATAVAGGVQITIDTPMPGITTGSFIFPASTNQQTYLDAIFSAFAGMGPGEWAYSGLQTSKRAFRHPIASLVSPSAMGASQLKTLINAGPEVLDASYLFTGDRSSSFGAISTPNPFTSPTVPSPPITVDPVTGYLTSVAPSIFVPRQIAWYAQ